MIDVSPGHPLKCNNIDILGVEINCSWQVKGEAALGKPHTKEDQGTQVNEMLQVNTY